MTRRTQNNAGVTLRPTDGHNRQAIRDALAATRVERKAERDAQKYAHRVGVIVPCDEAANVTDADLAAAQEKARAHFGSPVRLVEREGLVYSGPTTHLTFEVAR